MQVIPAIDVLDGKVVRLVQGDFARVTVFGDDPLEISERYRWAGAERLHLVNLSAARDGRGDGRFLDLVQIKPTASGRATLGAKPFRRAPK